MTEALRIAPGKLNGIDPETSVLPNFEIPFHLRRKTLKAIRREEGSMQEKLWTERGNIIEKRVQTIIASQTKIVKSVTLNEQYAKGSDLTVELAEKFPRKKLHIEVKSSGIGISDYKQKIRDNLPPEERNADGVKKWMTEQGIILINGSEEKSSEEILCDSFYPQLERIQQKALQEKNEPTQLFP